MTALHPPDTPYRQDAAVTDASASLGRCFRGSTGPAEPPCLFDEIMSHSSFDHAPSHVVDQLFRLSKRQGPFIFGVIQSGLTSAVAAAIAHSSDSAGTFLADWLRSWVLAWIAVLPIVLLAAPVIRKIVAYVTNEDS